MLIGRHRRYTGYGARGGPPDDPISRRHRVPPGTNGHGQGDRTSSGQREWHVWLSFWGVAWTSAALSAEHRDHYEAWRGLVHHLLREAERLGQTRPGLNLRQATDRLVALVDGLGLQATYEPARLTRRRVMAMIEAQLADFAVTPSPIRDHC